MQGVVKWFNRVKGYGFITAEGNDYFFHYTCFAEPTKIKKGELLDGRAAEFEPLAGERGLQANDVRMAPAA